MPGVSTSGIVRESTTPCWEKYLYQEKAHPKKLDLSGSFTRKRYTGIVNPNVEILDIATVLARADINYTPEEYPAEQPYIDNRLIPHMRTTKLPFPVIEIYTRDAVDNQRPHLPSGKRPFTDIHIIDGAHRIVALKKIGVKEIPFIVYREPGGNLMVKEGMAMETLTPEREPWQMTQQEYVQKHAPNFKRFLIENKAEGMAGEKFYIWSDTLGEWIIRWSRAKPTYSLYLNTKLISDPRTLEDAVKIRLALVHKSMVQRALMEGKPVPVEVLKEYQDLKAIASPPAPMIREARLCGAFRTRLYD